MANVNVSDLSFPKVESQVAQSHHGGGARQAPVSTPAQAEKRTEERLLVVDDQHCLCHDMQSPKLRMLLKSIVQALSTVHNTLTITLFRKDTRHT